MSRALSFLESAPTAVAQARALPSEVREIPGAAVHAIIARLEVARPDLCEKMNLVAAVSVIS